jgi:hypothetical protein
MPDGTSKAQPVRGILWFLFLLAVWMVTVLWPYWRTYGLSGSPKFDLGYALNLYFAPPIGAVVILTLMLADITSRRSTFPRNIVTLVAVATGINIVALILSYLGSELFGMRPPVVVSGIMIVRNIMRSLISWARTDN